MAMPAPRRRTPIASPLDEKPLPPWRIDVDRDGDIVVTDGLLVLAYPSHVHALKSLAKCSELWPNGTREGSPGELRKAHNAGWNAGARFLLPFGVLIGVAISTLVQLLRLMVGI